jgi:uncharacterized protein (TIGR02147 family)
MPDPVAGSAPSGDYLTMPATHPFIFGYSDFRLFLGDCYKARKEIDKKFSHRYIQEKIGAGSRGWFADLVKGRVTLSGNHMVSLAKLLKLNKNETDYFEAMVDYAQAGSHDEKNRHFQKMLSFKEVRADLVGMDRIDFYGKWYHSAIRELLFFYPFGGDFAALAHKLNPPIRQSEARESVKLLERLGFVETDGRGGYRSKDATLKKDPNFPSVVLANFLKTNIEMAVEALERYPKDERDISALTISLSEGAFEQVKEEIRALRKRILALTETDPHPAKVYQCNFQFFPLSL